MDSNAVVPLCTSCRACEEVLYGRESVSLSTSKEVSRAGELARWIVMDSGVSDPFNGLLLTSLMQSE